MTLTDDEIKAIETLMNGKMDYFHCHDKKFFIGQILPDTDGMLTPEGTLKDKEFCEIMYRSILHHAMRIQIVMNVPATDAVRLLVGRLIGDIQILDECAESFNAFSKESEGAESVATDEQEILEKLLQKAKTIGLTEQEKQQLKEILQYSRPEPQS